MGRDDKEFHVRDPFVSLIYSIVNKGDVSVSLRRLKYRQENSTNKKIDENDLETDVKSNNRVKP